MSNSKLASYTRYNPNCNAPRNHKIDRITIHHMAGNLTLDGCYNAAISRQGSSNYGIDSNGKIAWYVDEANRSWCSCSDYNDNRAITIEVANNSGEPNWTISSKAMTALIELCADICRRNGIAKLNYTGDTNGNMTLHKWFAPTACPGPYLEGKMSYIAAEVNKRLSTKTTAASTVSKPTVTVSAAFKSYKVKVTADCLNIRAGAGTGYKINGTIRDKGVYTIIAETNGTGAAKWGKLKSGAGWISLDWVKKI